MSFLLERDTLHGAAGKAFLTINGQVKELFGAKKVQTQEIGRASCRERVY